MPEWMDGGVSGLWVAADSKGGVFNEELSIFFVGL